MAKLPITTINGVDIFAETTENGIFVPVKTICQAIGLAYEPQYSKIQSDEILASTITIIVMVAADEKEREMVCLPLKFVYGWLFTINPGKVAPDIRESVTRYRRECYDALCDHFSGSMQRTIEANTEKIRLLQEQNELLLEERALKARRRENEKKLEKLRAERLNPQPRLL